MLTKPIIIAIFLTMLAGFPLYFLASGNYQLTLSDLPAILLPVFILSLIAAFWGAAGVTSHDIEESPDQSGHPRESGSVKWFNANKGFGFITRDNGDDVFVHFRSIRGKGHRVLHDGQRVEFILSESDKGLQAEDVAVAR